MTPPPVPVGRRHLEATRGALDSLAAHVDRLQSWAGLLADTFTSGGRLLTAGNGGSAAQAQHLSGELVGRYRDDRPPLSALALHTDTSSLTAICNDYGDGHGFSRQLAAHASRGDVFVAFSTSGRSPNVLEAAAEAARRGVVTLALAGPAPNPLAVRSDDAVCIDAPSVAAVQEAHLVAVHMLCAALDVALGVCDADVGAAHDLSTTA